MAKTLIVAQRVNELCRMGEKKLNVSKDLTEALANKTEKIIKKACQRAIANNRTTVMPRDI